MIRPEIIQRFLDRNLDNFDWVKVLAPSQIEEVLLAEGVPPHLFADLWDHQKAALAITLHQPRFIYHIGMGGGKTRLMLTHMQLRKLRGEQVRAIVFVPYVSAVQTWVDEAAKFAPELTCIPLTGSSKENARMLSDSNHHICVCCYASGIAMPNTVFAGFETFVMDEVHKVKNHTTKTFKLCKAISQQADYVYGLTGTPFGRDLQDLWAEFYCIDFGETLGPNISFFREIFFTKKHKFYGGVEYNPIKKRVPILQRFIKNKSLHYSVKEFGGNMPSKQYIKIGIPKPAGIEAYVARELLNLRQAIKAQDTRLAGNAFMQLRQLASGFVTFKEGDEERIKVKFDENPKVDKLMELIEAMPTECKMVVFHDYIYTGDLVAGRLKNEGVVFARIFGGTHDKPAQLRSFRDSDTCRVLVLNSQSGSSALNLQFANYTVFLECPSVIDREQAEARLYRPGQLNKVFIYDLLMDGTIDLEYLTTVKAGGDLLKDFLRGKKEVQND